ncbi:MAG: hypothetical protein R3F59_34840 [Myxococcota bacterium]
MHLAPDRAHAWTVAPAAIAWGLAACAIGPRLRPAHPAVLLSAALIVRAPLVGVPLHLSDDLWRYLWEGRALAAGIDVFTRAPATVDGLDDALRALVNHADVPSIYPPLALAWFRLLAAFGTPLAVQALTALADATVPASLALADRRSRAAWVYVLHPLPALESAAGGHIDVVAVALGAAALAAWSRRRQDAAWALLVGGALIKLFPGLLLPTLARSLPPRTALAWAALSVASTAAALAAVWPDATPPALAAYAGHWSFNGLAYPWLAPWLGEATRPVLVAAAGLGALVVWARMRDPAVAWFHLGALFLAPSPTVHPWYALWLLVPALATGRIAAAAATVPLLGSYTVLAAFDPATGAWAEAPWIWWITWPPALALFALDARGQLRSVASPTEPYPPANSARNGSDAQ